MIVWKNLRDTLSGVSMTSTMTSTKTSKKQASTLSLSTQDSPSQQRSIDTMLVKEKEKIDSQINLSTIQETLIKLQEMMQKTQCTIENNREEAKKHHEELKIELKVEMGDIKERVRGIDEKIVDVQKSLQENELRIKTVEERVEKIEQKIENSEGTSEEGARNLREAIIRLEMEKASYGLRFQNIVEEREEDLGTKMIEIVAKILQQDPRETIAEIDEFYRVQTQYTRRHNLPREVHIKFTRKTTRDTVFKWSRDQTLIYKEKEIIILKQVPKRVRENRKEYYFLTRKLLKDNIMFRWLIPEGLMFTWQDRKVKIEDVSQAREFYKESGIAREEQTSKESQGSKETLEETSQEEEEHMVTTHKEVQKKQLQQETVRPKRISEPRYTTRYTRRFNK